MLVVKRKGRTEKFDERKVYGSIYAACKICEMSEKQCEKIAGLVSKSVKKYVGKKKSITSDHIFREAAKELRKYDKDAAFMYETHRDVS